MENLLSSFDRLSQAEWRDAIREILHCAQNHHRDSLTDDELVTMADATFSALDEREATE